MNLDAKFEQLKNEKSDINEHLETLQRIGKQCDHITEFGTRRMVSTWALLSARPETLIAYDYRHPRIFGIDINDAFQTAQKEKISFYFYEKSVLEIEIEETDFLFIDTWHSYKQLNQELAMHGSKVRKFLGFHDTTTFEFKDEKFGSFVGHPEKKGLWLAIEEFLDRNPKWSIKERYTNNNGLTILEKN